MKSIPLPSTFKVAAGEQEHESIITIQPCFPGYAITLGNALRRVLLSSLPGGAVTAFRIKGASHEFTSVPHVAEDVVEITLNLKQLRVRVHSSEPVELELKAKGEGPVTAGDIKTTSDVEVINKDLVIATLTDKSAELEMRLIVSQGRGYVPTESREGEQIEVGMIAVDSIFTPVRNVGFQVENVRVGQMTNYEKLILSIQTDGTITAAEALSQATGVLIDHFQVIASGEKNSDVGLGIETDSPEVAANQEDDKADRTKTKGAKSAK